MDTANRDLNVQPLVSICIPAYNCASYIKYTLESVFKQSYSNIEIIVVDDGSSDETLDILRTVENEKLKLFSIANSGAAAARNLAYKKSNGTFIKFLDADDIINETCIEMQVQALYNQSDSVASAKWGRFFKNDLSDFQFSPEHVWKTMPGIDWVIDSIIENGSNMTQPGIFLISRSLIEKEGLWDESLSLIDDFEFMTRILTAAKKVIFCDEAILYYRGGMKGSLSMQKSRKSAESAIKAQLNGIEAILSKKQTAKSRLACANSLQLWAYGFYPHYLDLYNTVNNKIKDLGGSNIKMDGGKLFLFLRNLFGWRTAKRIKFFFSPFRKTDLQNPKFLIPKKSKLSM